MLYREDILKDKPDYEDYSENEVKLAIVRGEAEPFDVNVKIEKIEEEEKDCIE